MRDPREFDLTARPWWAGRVTIARGRHQRAATGALQLRLVERGSSYVRLDLGAGLRRVYTRPGDLLLSLPEQSTSFDVDAPREVVVVWVAARHAQLLASRSAGALPELAPLTAGPFRDPLIAELCRRLEQPGSHPAAALDAALTLLVANLLERARDRPPQAPTSRLTGATLRRVLDHIQQRISDPLTVEELAAVAGLRRRPFAAEFRLATGTTVRQYVLRRRVDLATGLLADTDRPIADIAAEAGFTHQAHLTRVLRDLTGSTPAEHRNRSAASGRAGDG